MALYLDSPWEEEAAQAFQWGLVEGITTNPALLAQTPTSNEETLKGLRAVSKGRIFYQPPALSLEERKLEALQAAQWLPKEHLGYKLPCTMENLALAKELVQQGHIVGMTAVFSPAQVMLACSTGAQFVLPYVNRSTRLLGDGIELVHAMRTAIDALESPTEIIAASIKSPEEAYETLAAGAHHLTLPFSVLQEMAEHPLTQQAIRDFAKAAKPS